MWEKVFVSIFAFGICILFFSCETVQGIFGSIGNSVSEMTNSNASNNNNSSSNNSSGTRLSPTKIDQNRRGDPDATNWDISALDTAAETDYLSPAEKDVILEMNKARADPKKYAELYLNPYKKMNKSDY